MIVKAAIKVGDTVYTAPDGGGVCKHHDGFTKTRHCCVYNNNSEIKIHVDRVIKDGGRPIQGY